MAVAKKMGLLDSMKRRIYKVAGGGFFVKKKAGGRKKGMKKIYGNKAAFRQGVSGNGTAVPIATNKGIPMKLRNKNM